MSSTSGLAAIRATVALARTRLERQPHSGESSWEIAGQIRAAARMCGRLTKASGTLATRNEPRLYRPELNQAERFLLEAADEIAEGRVYTAINKLQKAEQLISDA